MPFYLNYNFLIFLKKCCVNKVTFDKNKQYNY